jgi:hypothetical protein
LTTPSGTNTADIVQKHSITFHELRMAPVQALVPIVFGEKNSWKPKMWINGLGKIVETNSTLYDESERGKDPSMASDVYQGQYGWFKIRKLHSKDACHCGAQDRSGCDLSGADQFFPFAHSAKVMLK